MKQCTLGQMDFVAYVKIETDLWALIALYDFLYPSSVSTIAANNID
jgi:hypothetical protein